MNLCLLGGKGWEEGIVRELGMDMSTLVYLNGPTRSYCRAQGTLLSMMCSLDGRGARGTVATWICMAESLCCPPETITTVLIGYTLI